MVEGCRLHCSHFKLFVGTDATMVALVVKEWVLLSVKSPPVMDVGQSAGQVQLWCHISASGQ